MPVTRIIKGGPSPYQNSFNTMTEMYIACNKLCHLVGNDFYTKGNQVYYANFEFEINETECVKIYYGSGAGRDVKRCKITAVGKPDSHGCAKHITTIDEYGNVEEESVGVAIIPLDYFYSMIKEKVPIGEWKNAPVWAWSELGVKPLSKFTIWERIDKFLGMTLIPTNGWMVFLLVLTIFRIILSMGEVAGWLIRILWIGMYMFGNYASKQS